MRRLAVVDMLVDLELPERFAVSYDFHDNLVAVDSAQGLTLEVGGSTFAPPEPDLLNGCAEHVARKARADGEQLVLDVPGLAIVLETAEPHMLQWTAGFGNRLLVATLTADDDRPPLDADEAARWVVPMLRTLRSTFPAPLPDGKRFASFALAPSQELWFAQQRANVAQRVRDDLGLGFDGLVPLDVLDTLWEQFLGSEPDDGDAAPVLRELGVAVGDHLVRARNLEWVMLSDQFGFALGVAARAGEGTFWSDPFTFVAKRWEARAGPFLAHGVAELCRIIARQTAAW